MSGELGFYNIVDGLEGDRDDLKLWYDGDGLVCSASTATFFLLSQSR